ncbi:MAG: hypothetical protein U1D30_25525 [Planctomycetota bacterium]
MNTPVGQPLSISRHAFFWAYWTLFAAFFTGYVCGVRPTMSPNDNSRWDTVWSLVEHGTYQIFDTPEEAKKYNKPEQMLTIDKIQKDGKYYSSKPPLMPTVIAGYVQCLKWVVGEEFSKDHKDAEGKFHRGSIWIYGNATILMFNLVPFLLFLWLYRRFLDRLELGDFAWCFSLIAAGIGTLVTGYLVTLNNHTPAACFAFFTAYLLMTMWYDGKRDWWRFTLAGFCSGWAATNELPAGMLVVVAMLVAFRLDWKKTLVAFLPPLLMVTAAFFYTNHAAIGEWKPAYLIKSLYDYPNSYWTNSAQKSGIDALNDRPESKFTFLVHMTIGHHGVFSLTPIFFFAAWGALLSILGKERRLPGLHWPITLISAVVFLFYWIINSERNYGGMCHGMRWLLWLYPLWLLFLPSGLDERNGIGRMRHFAWACLLFSVFTMAETMYQPWYSSWLHRTMSLLKLVDY